MKYGPLRGSTAPAQVRLFLFSSLLLSFRRGCAAGLAAARLRRKYGVYSLKYGLRPAALQPEGRLQRKYGVYSSPSPARRLQLEVRPSAGGSAARRTASLSCAAAKPDAHACGWKYGFPSLLHGPVPSLGSCSAEGSHALRRNVPARGGRNPEPLWSMGLIAVLWLNVVGRACLL